MAITRIDRYETNEHGQQLGYCDWMGGPTLSNVKNAHVMRFDEQARQWVDTGLRRAARVTGEPLTHSSIPAYISLWGARTRGWLGCRDGVWRFHVNRF